jgi:hypothetical protein
MYTATNMNFNANMLAYSNIDLLGIEEIFTLKNTKG